MGHPLDSAFLRLKRADSHIAELKAVLRRFEEAHKEKILAKQQVKIAELGNRDRIETPVGRHVLENVPPEVSILTGEIAYNLRSALDYLIYELSRKDSGVIHDGTQFPIADFLGGVKKERGSFSAARETRLAGLNSLHIKRIEALQPYNGVAWTEALRDVSNKDKHRHLTATIAEGWGNGVVEIGRPGSFDDRLGIVIRDSTGAGMDTHVNLDYTIEITLPDGSDLVETLEDIKANVASTLESFRADF